MVIRSDYCCLYWHAWQPFDSVAVYTYMHAINLHKASNGYCHLYWHAWQPNQTAAMDANINGNNFGAYIVMKCKSTGSLVATF